MEDNNNVEEVEADNRIPVVGDIRIVVEVERRESQTEDHSWAYTCSYWCHGSLEHNNRPLIQMVRRHLGEPHIVDVEVADIVAVGRSKPVVFVDPFFAGRRAWVGR